VEKNKSASARADRWRSRMDNYQNLMAKPFHIGSSMLNVRRSMFTFSPHRQRAGKLLFMQNEPKTNPITKRPKMNITEVLTGRYEDSRLPGLAGYAPHTKSLSNNNFNCYSWPRASRSAKSFFLPSALLLAMKSALLIK